MCQSKSVRASVSAHRIRHKHVLPSSAVPGMSETRSNCVGERGAIEDGIAMIRDGGFYYVIGYG
jgi:hypothetical protein